MFHIFMKNEKINYVWMVIGNMLSTMKIMAKAKYGESYRMRREGLSYVCHLTRIFKYFKVNFEGYIREKVKSLSVVKKKTLKNLKIYERKNREFVFGPN